MNREEIENKIWDVVHDCRNDEVPVQSAVDVIMQILDVQLQQKTITEEEIEKKYPEYNSSGVLLEHNLARREAVQWAIEKLK